MPEITRRDLFRAGLALSAATFISDSALARANAALSAYSGVASAEARSAVAPREQILFDFGW